MECCGPNKEDDQKWKIESLASDIRRVECAKKDEPEIYEKALAKLKNEADSIMSIDDIRKIAKKKSGEEKSSDE